MSCGHEIKILLDSQTKVLVYILGTYWSSNPDYSAYTYWYDPGIIDPWIQVLQYVLMRSMS